MNQMPHFGLYLNLNQTIRNYLLELHLIGNKSQQTPCFVVEELFDHRLGIKREKDG